MTSGEFVERTNKRKCFQYFTDATRSDRESSKLYINMRQLFPF